MANYQYTDEDKSRMKNMTLRDIVMIESDYHKKQNEKVQLEAEIRLLKKKDSEIRVELQDKQVLLSRIDQDVAQMEADLHRLKNKLNQL